MKAQLRVLLGENNYSRLYQLSARFNPLWKGLRQKKKATERKIFYTSLIKPGELCFDIGANYGNRVEAFLAAGADVIAVEPQLSCCKLLQKKFGSKMKIINKGVGSKPGHQHFYQSGISALSTFSEEWITAVKDQRFETQWEDVGMIEMTTLDVLIAEFGKPFYIKIDVEGYESEVLAGLQQPVPLISFEYTVPERTQNVINCINKVASLQEHAECNYTLKEQMQFELDKWVSAAAMKDIVQTNSFIAGSAGDIYMRQKPVQNKSYQP